ncbi:MAG: preprotein translocase subunit YajC, partial [Rhodospirillales bacterium]|nr:preprotein translocase subunit YajC [Rhodospirillales bacterium]
GGIIGLVTKVISDNEVQVELAEGVRVRIIKQTITDIVTRGESVRGSKDASDDDDKPMLPPAAPAAERKSLLGSLFGGKK